MKYGYWWGRGVGQVNRLILAYTGSTWENITYKTNESWFDKDKKELGLVFPNLPYLIDGDFKLTESRAINLYVVKKSGKTELLGKTLEDQARVESIIGVNADLRNMLRDLAFDPEWKSKFDGVMQKVVPKFNYLAEYVGERSFAIGYLTIADFYLSEMSYYVENIAPELYPKLPFLNTIRVSVESLPEIKAYYASETAIKGPFFPPYAAIKF